MSIQILQDKPQSKQKKKRYNQVAVLLTATFMFLVF